ncbi:MAG: YebC/PmpR family DNA-binding transcriptional regulator [Planctomycetota bacterium]|nr:YebC/PmpR family DNA-binding transcriptional regulator [Planctomycetota bacterium]
MGRIFEKRKTTMFARWDRVSRQFARIAKEIAIAVKAGGPNVDANLALRRAMQNARAANMPKDKVEAAIRRASGQEGENYEEVIYEGYAPHGIAVLIETATDNPTRTVANVRTCFKKAGGNLGSVGSVSFQFQRLGVFRLPAEGLDADELELDLIDHGLEEMRESESEEGEAQLVIRCGFTDLGAMQRALEERDITPSSSRTEYVCLNPVTIDAEPEAEVLAMVDALEQDEDVQHVYHSLA